MFANDSDTAPRASRLRSFEALSISEAAQAVGATVRALRLYEQRGLLTIPRTGCNARLYTEATLEDAWRIARLRALGVPLKTVARLLQDRRDAELLARLDLVLRESARLCDEVRSMALAGSIPPSVRAHAA